MRGTELPCGLGAHALVRTNACHTHQKTCLCVYAGITHTYVYMSYTCIQVYTCILVRQPVSNPGEEVLVKGWEQGAGANWGSQQPLDLSLPVSSSFPPHLPSSFGEPSGGRHQKALLVSQHGHIDNTVSPTHPGHPGS